MFVMQKCLGRQLADLQVTRLDIFISSYIVASAILHGMFLKILKILRIAHNGALKCRAELCLRSEAPIVIS